MTTIENLLKRARQPIEWLGSPEEDNQVLKGIKKFKDVHYPAVALGFAQHDLERLWDPGYRIDPVFRDLIPDYNSHLDSLNRIVRIARGIYADIVRSKKLGISPVRDEENFFLVYAGRGSDQKLVARCRLATEEYFADFQLALVPENLFNPDLKAERQDGDLMPAIVKQVSTEDQHLAYNLVSSSKPDGLAVASFSRRESDIYFVW